MHFHEKLDFLMNITKTSNSVLARHASLDASHISRLRRGERGLSKNQNYVQAMATYLARHCKEDYQKKALLEALDVGDSLSGQNEIADLLAHWLLEQKTKEEQTVEGFLQGLTDFQFRKPPQPVYHEEKSIVQERVETFVYYGVEGKRVAVLAFLATVLRCEQPQTLLLFSDEDMEWMTADPAFAAQWASLMSQVILKGNRIKIIHTVSRNLDEMLTAIGEWMPLYMTGAIEPYHYPKKRDGIFKRTLFIAPSAAAVISTSVGSMNEKAANFIFHDHKTIRAITDEFTSYLALCRPLMQIFRPSDRLEYLKLMIDAEKEKTNAIIKTETLSLVTMPDSVAKRVVARSKNLQKSTIMQYYRSRKETFEKNLQDRIFTEIIKIPDITVIKDGKTQIGYSNMLANEELFYTEHEFKIHVLHIVDLLKKYKNYRVCLSYDLKGFGYTLYAREDIGAMIAKLSPPSVILVINENNMTAAFWDFLLRKVAEAGPANLNKEQVIKKLEAIANELT
ncbi:MAG: transcriptional regulator [Firmicutes bacterium]|nr:transcriptional regulator [Bacillota bacterium]